MRICGALAWWNEPVEWLDRCVRSLAGVCDRLVALDGRWAGVEAPGFLSDAVEYHAIQDAAVAVGVDCEVVAPGGLWESQVAKRDDLMGLASAGADWVLVIDGDEHVAWCDRPIIDQALELTGRHAAAATITPMNQGWPYNRMPTRPYPMPRLFRAGTSVEVAHNGYRYAGEWLLGDRAYVRVATPLDLSGSLTISHDNMNRPAERKQLAAGYRKTRQRERLEEWAR